VAPGALLAELSAHAHAALPGLLGTRFLGDAKSSLGDAKSS
jgi:hypothetical protein